MTRSILELTGDDRISFLQGLLTQDVTQLANARIQFAALLSPQGKILHDMFLIAHEDRIWIDTPQIHAATLLKRLTMYKLRAKIVLRDLANETAVTLVVPNTPHALPDPRHADLPWRLYGATTERTVRMPLLVPDSATDFAPDDITAMDAGYDALNAISFTKGCYVGQEIVARMHYKNIARKGFFLVEGEKPLSAGAALVAGEKQIGTLARSDEHRALVFLKFEDALNDRQKTVDNQAVQIIALPWMQAKIAIYQSADATA